MLLREHENIFRARARVPRGLESFPPEGLGQCCAGRKGLAGAGLGKASLGWSPALSLATGRWGHSG